MGQPSAKAVGELVRTTPPCLVTLDAAVDQLKLFADRAMQLLRVVSRDRHSAALVWTVASEGSNDREAAGLQCLERLGDLALALFSRCEEMEHRAVVPYVVRLGTDGLC